MAEKRKGRRQSDEQSPGRDEPQTPTEHLFDDASNIREKMRKWRGLLEEMINGIDDMPANGRSPSDEASPAAVLFS
ncbi:hypothetical protein Q7P35_006971 [Cladosporium inversicolor]